MRGRSARLALEHIRDTIALLDDYLTGKSRDDYAREPMLRHAVERCIEIVSEARAGSPTSSRPGIPRFHGPRWLELETSCGTTTTRSTTPSCGTRPPSRSTLWRPRSSRCWTRSRRSRPSETAAPNAAPVLFYLSSVVSDRGAVRQVVTDQDKGARRHRNQWAGSGSRSSLIRRVGEAHCDNGA